MRCSFRNILCGLAVLVAAGLLADLAYAQGNVTLLAEDDDDTSFDPILPNESAPKSGLISPQAPAGQSKPSDVIPMDVDTHTPSDLAADSGDGNANIDMQVETNAQPDATQPVVAGTSNTVAPTAAPAAPAPAPAPAPEVGIAAVLADNINNELFMRMSDLEKQTTLLNLELKKERLANEIAAVKAQRKKAQEEEEARKAEAERKRIEWENEQERLMVEEQRKLKEVEMALEKLRQEKIVKAYKETMLASTQKWIKKNAEIYAEVARKDEQINEMLKDYKEKFGILAQRAEDVKGKAEVAKVNHDKKVANLENQIATLKTRLEAEIEKARQAALAGGKGKNPFADGTSEAVAPEKVKLSKEYAIMEILGSGDDLAAKLVNDDGNVFMVKVGTTLRNGYTVDEITKTFLSAVKDNDKDYLYFSAGGILDREPIKPAVTIKEPTGGSAAKKNEAQSSGPAFMRTRGIPSLGNGMIVK